MDEINGGEPSLKKWEMIRLWDVAAPVLAVAVERKKGASEVRWETARTNALIIGAEQKWGNACAPARRTTRGSKPNKGSSRGYVYSSYYTTTGQRSFCPFVRSESTRSDIAGRRLIINSLYSEVSVSPYEVT